MTGVIILIVCVLLHGLAMHFLPNCHGSNIPWVVPWSRLGQISFIGIIIGLFWILAEYK